MLCVENLHYHVQDKVILNEVSFTLPKGRTLCIVGESGSGKTSLLKALQGLVAAKFDRLTFATPNGPSLQLEQHWPKSPGLPGSRWVMQDPIAALDPKMRLRASIEESLYTQRLSRQELDQAVSSALADVELTGTLANRRPAEVSLGQAQRACLARALVARPQLIFFDEPLSALDAIVQKQVAATMDKIQSRYGISYVIVTHDLGFAAAYADQILVLRNGTVEANQSAEDFFENPPAGYCRTLLEAAFELGSLESKAPVHTKRPEAVQ